MAINPTILDGKGERMSKSKGNGVDPVDIVDSYGADALRFTLTKMATETQDARMPVKRDASGKNTSDKFDEAKGHVIPSLISRLHRVRRDGGPFAVWGTALYLYTGALYLAQITLALRAPRASVDQAPG